MKMSADDPMFDGALSLAHDENAKFADRRLACFALGKAYQDAKDWKNAFLHYQIGNDLHPDKVDMEDISRRVRLTEATFTKEFCETFPIGRPTRPRMIFIVGMPRSGTTLLERIITAHPDATTAGERPDMGLSYENFIQQAVKAQPDKTPAAATRDFMSQANLVRLQQHYLKKVAAHADDKDAGMIIDKLPHNFWRVGLLAAAFADAVIIHARRHPMDICWSCYTQNFKNGLVYTTRQATLAAYYRAYDRLMGHWRQVLGDRFLEVDYEEVVTDFETQARRIIDHCGLPWDDACARPEEAAGAVATASRWQVRQKVYKTSVQKWRNYEPYLQPLITALGGMEWIESRAWRPSEDGSEEAAG
jgi:hypothetical protein